MSKDPPKGKAQLGAQSGFFADTLGPRTFDPALLGKNAAAPVPSRQEGGFAATSQPRPAASAPPRASAPPPRQPEPEPPKKKKGWF